MQVESRAYILHQRPYQNSSAIIEFFTLEHGRIAAVARGLSRQKKYGSSVQSFTPLDLICKGKGELLNVHSCEALSEGLHLKGKAMFCGMYINELLLNFLPKNEKEIQIFSLYEDSLEQLSQTSSQVTSQAESQVNQEIILRHFELNTLLDLGYGLNLEKDINGSAIAEAQRYRYRLDQGFEASGAEDAAQLSISGSTIVAMRENNYQHEAMRREAKQLMRSLINHHLNGKQLKTRELFL